MRSTPSNLHAPLPSSNRGSAPQILRPAPRAALGRTPRKHRALPDLFARHAPLTDFSEGRQNDWYAGEERKRSRSTTYANQGEQRNAHSDEHVRIRQEACARFGARLHDWYAPMTGMQFCTESHAPTKTNMRAPLSQNDEGSDELHRIRRRTRCTQHVFTTDTP